MEVRIAADLENNIYPRNLPTLSDAKKLVSSSQNQYIKDVNGTLINSIFNESKLTRFAYSIREIENERLRHRNSLQVSISKLFRFVFWYHITANSCDDLIV